MHCNLRPPEPRQPFPALITTPYQVWSRWIYPLPYYSVFAADTLLYAVTLTSDPVTLTFDLWPWTFAAYCLWCDETLYQIWTQLNNPRRSYCDFSVWSYDLEHVLSVVLARLWDYFHQIWPSTTYPCLNYSVFWCWYVISSCDFDLWHDDLESSWYIKCHVIKVCAKFERNRAVLGWVIDIANFWTRYVAQWPWPLTSWSWTFTALRVSCV